MPVLPCLSLPCLEATGIATCSSISTLSICICGCGNILAYIKKDRKKTFEPEEHEHFEVNVAHSVRCIKNGEDLGVGIAKFDGQVVALPCASENVNVVSLGDVLIDCKGKTLSLIPKAPPIKDFQMEFSCPSEAHAWQEFLTQAAEGNTVTHRSRLDSLQKKAAAQEYLIKTLYEKKVTTRQANIHGHKGRLESKLENLNTELDPTRLVHQSHVNHLEDKLRAVEVQREIQSMRSPQMVALSKENAALKFKVEELNSGKFNLSRKAMALQAQVTQLEQKIQRSELSGNDEIPELAELQQQKDELRELSSLIMKRVEELERFSSGDSAVQGQAASTEDHSARIQELQTQLQGFHAERENLILQHQEHVSMKDSSLSEYVGMIQQHNQQLLMHEEQHRELQQRAVGYEQMLNSQNEAIMTLSQQAQEAGGVAPEVDTSAIDLARAQRMAASQRAQEAEARIMALELEFQKAQNAVDMHRLNADREATNAQAETARAQALHQEHQVLQAQLLDVKQSIVEQQGYEAQLQQQGGQITAANTQQLADAQAQGQVFQDALIKLEQTLQAKDAQYQQELVNIENMTNQRINEIALTLQAKDQQVAALAGEVQTLRESAADIPQLESEREQLFAMANQEQSRIAAFEADINSFEIAQQQGQSKKAEECLQLQDQLQGSRDELVKAQAQIVELEQELLKAELAAKEAAQVASPKEATKTRKIGADASSYPVVAPKVAALEEQLTLTNLSQSSTAGYVTNSVRPAAYSVIPGGSMTMPVQYSGSGTMPLPIPAKMAVASSSAAPVRISYGSAATRSQYPTTQLQTQGARASPMRGSTISASAPAYTMSTGSGRTNAYSTPQSQLRQELVTPISQTRQIPVAQSPASPSYGVYGATASPGNVQYVTRNVRVASSPMSNSNRIIN